VKKFLLISIFLVFLLIFLRLLSDEKSYLYKGLKFLNKGKYSCASVYFERVLFNYIPFSKYVKISKNKLLKLAEEFESKGELYKALYFYETLRSAFYQARSFYLPESEVIFKIDEKIAKIKSKILIKDGLSKDFKESYKKQIFLLKEDLAPSNFWSFIATVSRFCWIACIVFLILRKKIKFTYFALLFYFLWILALTIA